MILNEPSSPRSSVNVHRSNTSRRPFLSLDPVEFSLTDGTSIPAPPQDVDTRSGSPVSPIREEPRTNKKANGLNTQVGTSSHGPLSSHPVTPIEAASGSDKASFPLNRQTSNSISSNRANGHPAGLGSQDGRSTPARGSTPNTMSPLLHHRHNGLLQGANSTSPEPSGAFHRVDSPPLQTGLRSRRPSFAERFLRLRSISSLRSRNSTNAPLAQTQHAHNDGSQFVDGASHASAEALGSGSHNARGAKRPGSPSIAGLFRSTGPGVNGDVGEAGYRGSQSFPRMVRKKSMEILGTARRKSGMWTGGGGGGGGGDTINTVMAEEYEREKMRESEVRESEKDAGDSMELEGRQSKMSMTGRESVKEPPPTLPQIDTFKEMEGESMFSDIGR